MDNQEWEAWLANPITEIVRGLIKDRHEEYILAKSELSPRAYEDAHSFYADSLVLTARAESYLAMFESLSADAFDSIFEETE